MNKEEYRLYLKSDHWKKVRSFIYVRKGKKCQLCKQKRHLHIHHLNYDNLWNEKISDLMILCKNCHAMVHEKWFNKDDLAWKPKKYVRKYRTRYQTIVSMFNKIKKQNYNLAHEYAKVTRAIRKYLLTNPPQQEVRHLEEIKRYIVNKYPYLYLSGG